MQEEILCGLFGEVLGVERVGVDDNFFALGGQSLLATRLVSRVRAVLGHEVGVRDLFRAPSVREFARRLASVAAGGERPVLAPVERAAEVPVSFAQRRLWFLGELEGPSSTYNVPWLIRLSGRVDVDALDAAVNDVVGRHEALRTVFPSVGGEPLQSVRPAGDVRVPVERVDVTAEGVDDAVAAASERVFDLSSEIPVRAWVFRISEDEHVLLLLLHHIASDGWSVGPLGRDLSVAYGARLAGFAPAWEPLPVQYADYAVWQRGLLGDAQDPESLEARQLSYWRGQLSELPEVLDLPSDRTRPQVASYRGGIHRFGVPAALHGRLSELARDNQSTLFMVMQAAMAALLTRLGAGTDIPIGAPLAGRTEDGLDDLVGFFVNTVVLRTDTSEDPSFRELLERVRSTDLEAYGHQDIPFERLVEELNPTRSTAHHPLFQVMLAFQHSYEGRIEIPGAEVTWTDVPSGTAKFDLAVSVAERHTADGGPAGLTLEWNYAKDLFDEETVAAFGARLVRLLEGVTADPDRRIGTLSDAPAVTAAGTGTTVIDTAVIEEALRTHEQVASAVALVRNESVSGERSGGAAGRIVAHVVPAAGAAFDETAVREHLAAVLPAALIPGVFVVRDGGPAPAPATAAPAAAPVRASLTAQEEILCGIFGEILKVERVEPDDNFFALGGHSLLATRLVSRVRAVLGYEVGVRDLFRAPSVREFARRLASSAAGGERPVLAPVERAAEVPVSFAQRRLWFLGQLEGPSSTYNVPWLIRLAGRLDVDALGAAVNDVVGRHEALRTVFPSVGGEPLQSIRPAEEALVALERVDVAADGVDEAVSAASRTPFDLATEIPVRAWVFRVSDEEHYLLLLLHHIASDGWSVGPLGRDLSTAYGARLAGGAPGWQPPAVQYADYAVWQRELLGATDDPGSLDARQLAYWRGQLADLPQELALPVDRTRPQVASPRGGIHRFGVPAALHGRLSELARDNQSTLFMVVQAAVAALLTRLGAGTDIPIGAPLAGRTEDGLDDLVGFFVNTVVLRTDTSEDPTFRELLGRVRSTDLEAYGHQDIPFERLVEELNPTRSTAHHPLFQVMLAFLQATDGEQLALPGLSTSWHDVVTHTAKFDLDFGMTERHTADREPAGIDAHIEYLSDLFDHDTVVTIGDRLVRLLEAVAADPDRRIGTLDVLGDEERAALLRTGGDTRVDHADERPVHRLFAARAAETPDAVAVVCGDVRLTYRELDVRAGQVARHLIARGAGPEVPVAICLERGPDMIVAMLGILKAGAGYVPLDPANPVQRLQFMLDETRTPLVVTQESVAGRLPVAPGRQLLLMDRDRPVLDALDGTDPAVPVDPSSLAYVIYTSGSTGTPKGVMIEHRSMSNRLQEMRQRYGLGPADRTLQFASISFDAAAEQIFPTLMAGGRIVLRDGETWTPAQSLRVIREQGVTVAEFTPAMWQQVVARLEAGDTHGDSFRLLVLGGEAVPVNLVAQWFRATTVPICNTYGPTETTISATAYTLTGPVDRVPIGRPIGNTEAYVMDPGGGLAPAGVPGELWIGGVGVARGYWERPELTAGVFVPHPFSADPEARLYRTGDLVRWLPDGNLEFLGRIDHQVKLRGLRIELGEIEAALVAQEEIASAVVLVREDEPGDTRLVAYTVPAQGRTVDVPAVRLRCKDALPEYMIPGAFVVMEALPLTTSGKIDRQALPAPAAEREHLASDYSAPRNEIEAALAEVWKDVLGVDHVGIHDSFFELGGHSLLATRVVNKVDLLTGLEISLKDFFAAPTVASLAARLLELIALEDEEDGAEGAAEVGEVFEDAGVAG
ncbi:amino acid adenylation domain-containing protein [Streptomyces sp. SR27]|uniref:non-ribosomal peptide synthetase n=1 Tax=Streptomyces sp. SR27 TaxID=3076630 RepID=UPI00295B1404|nr:non-ribosomal peptide synthetase [Streptomyces sp. SR27]MDV9187878.1 amino acid adenylation domain-containing protein [Streptomyces sp. SR27]